MTMLSYPYSYLVCLVLVFLFHPFLTHRGQLASAEGNNYVREACNGTKNPDLCIQLLAPFSNTAKRSLSKWSQAGVSVTIREVKKVQANLERLKRSDRIRDRIGLLDCIEEFTWAFKELDDSLGVLRRLSRSKFRIQMGDVTTWVSAADTDAQTCLDGFEGQKGRDVESLRNQVMKFSDITINALHIINRLASTGLEGSVIDPFYF